MLGINITLKHAHITLLDPFFRKWLLKRKQVLSVKRTRFENSCKSVVIVKGVKHDAKLEKYKMLSFVF